jgi:hypothetical protein
LQELNNKDPDPYPCRIYYENLKASQCQLAVAETRRKLLQPLSVVNSTQKCEKVGSMRHRNTGSWIFATPEYMTLYDLKGSAVLCCMEYVSDSLISFEVDSAKYGMQLVVAKLF